MLKLSKLTDYSTVILTCMAHQPQQLMASADIALATHISLPTVSKILKKLTRAGLLISERGTHGGYRLAEPPENIPLTRIIETMEAKLAVTDCSHANSQCDLEPYCTIHTHWKRINDVIQNALNNISLAELVQSSNTFKLRTKNFSIPIHVTDH